MHGFRTPYAAFSLPVLLGLIVGLFMWTPGCGSSVAEERALIAADPAAPVVLAAPWPWDAQDALLYRQGIDLAVAQVNDAGGVLGGRPLRVVRHDDGQSINRGSRIAVDLAATPEVMAVVGHLQSYVTNAAVPIYEEAGLVTLVPSSTDQAVTSAARPRTFRLAVTNEQIGQHLADVAAASGYEQVLICYVESQYGRTLANVFERALRENGIDVVERTAYPHSLTNDRSTLRRLVRRWPHDRADALFLAADVPIGAHIVDVAREEGVTLPILGGDALSGQVLIQVGGASAEGTRVPSRFHPGDPRPVVRDFVDAFRTRYGTEPDEGAAIGYDAIRLYARAVDDAGTPHPDRVAAVLSGMAPVEGVTGPLGFDAVGDRVGTGLQTLVVQDGRLVRDG